jgi:hypothetical protein
VAVAGAVGVALAVGCAVAVAVGSAVGCVMCACASRGPASGAALGAATLATSLVVAAAGVLVAVVVALALASVDAAGCAGVRIRTNAIDAMTPSAIAATAVAATNTFDTAGFGAPSCVSPHVTDVPPDTATRADDASWLGTFNVAPGGGASLCQRTVDATAGETKCTSAVISSPTL